MLRLDPLEIPALGMEPCDYAIAAVEARLVSPTASALALTRVPARVHADQPLEIELDAVGLSPGVSAAVSVASWISANARLHISVDVPGQRRREVFVHATACPSGSGWNARALIHPATWADAASVTVVSLSLAGRPLPCDCLPATLKVGYNHAPAPAGSVYAAAIAGDVAALQAALDAGGSTEEADEVRGNGKNAGGKRRRWQTTKWEPPPSPPPSPVVRQHCLLVRGHKRPP